MSSPATGDRLRALWQADIYEFCGTQETNYFAFSCPHGTFHWNEDLIYPEVLDPATKKPVALGEPGELVVTDLVQRTHPLIRFPTGDLVHGFDTEPCSCGRTFARFKGFIGRIDDVVKIRGVSVAPSAIEHIVRSHPEASDDYEIELYEDANGLDAVRVRVEPRRELGVSEVDALGKDLAEQLRRSLFISVLVNVVGRGLLERFEFKAKRFRDNRTSATKLK